MKQSKHLTLKYGYYIPLNQRGGVFSRYAIAFQIK